MKQMDINKIRSAKSIVNHKIPPKIFTKQSELIITMGEKSNMKCRYFNLKIFGHNKPSLFVIW